MASESKAKVIERNRAPRVQIAYDVEHYGSPTTIELPFVMGVMAELAGASQTKEAQKTLLERGFVESNAGAVYRLDKLAQERALRGAQRIADIFSHLVEDRAAVVRRMRTIESLTRM